MNGALLSWSTAIVRAGLAGLPVSAVRYVYLYSDSGTPALLESATEPVWDAALGYWKLGGGTPDATRRCVGFFNTTAAAGIRQFLSVPSGREREVYWSVGGAVTELEIVSGRSDTSWTLLNLAPWVPSHATHWRHAAKIAFAASGDEMIVGISPTNLGTVTGSNAIHTVRNRASAAGMKTFFGQEWGPLATPKTAYYRTQTQNGTPNAEVEAHGAKFRI